MRLRLERTAGTLLVLFTSAAGLSASTVSSFPAAIFTGFERNEGQTDPLAMYLARTRGYTAFVTDTGLVLSLSDQHEPSRRRGVSLSFESACEFANVSAVDELPGLSNYFRSDRLITGVRSFGRLTAKDIYPNIDIQYRLAKGNVVVFDLIAHPGADLSDIRLHIEGGDICIDPAGNLMIDARDGVAVTQRLPVVHQETSSGRRDIAAEYRLLGSGNVAIDVGDFDPSRDLVIDPALLYATYINGPASIDNAYGIFVDVTRNVYITGDTASTDFPVVGSPVYGTYQGGQADAFVIKYAPGGTRIFSTFLGGTEADRGYVVTADSLTNVYVAGTTHPGYSEGSTSPGPTFPFTAGAFKTYPYANAGVLNGPDIFVAKLTPTGSALIYAAHIAGSFSQKPAAIVVDANQNVYLTGEVTSPTSTPYKPFPTTPGVIQRNGSLVSGDFGSTTTYDGFILKLNSSGSALIFSTLFGGQFDDKIEGMATDSSGAIWIAGRTQSVDLPVTQNAYQSSYLGTVRSTLSRDDDGFLAKINANGTQVLYCTYLGTITVDRIHSIAVDKDDGVYIVGETWSSNVFPTTPNAYKKTGAGGFLGKFSSNGTVDFITMTGGDSANAVAVNGGLPYVAGYSRFTPIDVVSPDQSTNAGNEDAFLQRFNSTGKALEYSTYLGGGGDDRALALFTDEAGNAYLAGTTSSSNFPTTPNAAQPTSSGSAGFFAKYVFDSDGDGLLDTWETNGIDIDSDGTIDLNLAQLGADPNHKDLFVEIDYMVAANHTHRPGYTPSGSSLPVDPIQQVITALANALVQNPDGRQGINLHVLVDEALTEQSFMTFAPPPPAISDFKTIKNGLPASPCAAGHFGTPQDRTSSNCSNILKAKRLVYRYCIFGHNHENIGVSGIAELGGNDFAVTLRVKETGPDFEKQALAMAAQFSTTFNAEWTDMVAGTFMHELGHTLSLDHGGGLGIGDPLGRRVDLKPNYLSVMNHARQFNFAGPDANAPTVIIRGNRQLEYSRTALPTLNESSLFESLGVSGPVGQFTFFGQGFGGAVRVASAGGAIDWNGQNGIESSAVAADINYLAGFRTSPSQAPTPSPGDILAGHDDWSNLVYSFRGSRFFGDGAPNDTDSPREQSDVDISAFVRGEQPPTVTLTAPSEGQLFSEGSTVTFTAVASDPDGTVQKVEFLDGGTVVGEDTTAPYEFSWTNAAVGTHIVSARATDNAGGMSASAMRTIHVGCSASLSPSAASIGFAGGSGTIALAIASNCAWNALSDASWLMVDTTTGSGGATLAYHVEPNTADVSRTGTISVAGQAFPLTQDAAPPFGPPTNVVATAIRRVDSSFFVHITWTGVANVDHYETALSSDGTTFSSDGVTMDQSYDSNRGGQQGVSLQGPCGESEC